jgi:hypothetical protein
LKPPPGVAIAEPTSNGASSSTPTSAPATMFLGSALGLGLTALLVARAPSAVRATFQRRSRSANAKWPADSRHR